MPGSDRRVDFGYNPPSGTRGIEQFPPQTFVRDLQNALDIASQSFSSLWVSDHLMTVEPFRMDVWTQLTWIAARYPSQMLGTIVLANNYRHPPLMAKMAASLQAFSRGRLILGYGAGWHEPEYRAYGYAFPSARVRIEQPCRDVGREYASIRKTLTRSVFLAPTRSAAEQWAGSKLDTPNPPFAGEPAALVDHLHELVDLGFDLFQMVFAGFPDTADLR